MCSGALIKATQLLRGIIEELFDHERAKAVDAGQPVPWRRMFRTE